MKPMTTKQTIVWSVILAAVWMGLEAWRTDNLILKDVALTGLFFFLVAFLSMRMSSRVTQWAQTRFGKPPVAPPEPMTATTQRPDHVQKRRTKRRKRSYRRQR